MKAVKIVGHPLVIVSLFLFVVIEGVHFGGFYLIYLLFGLMYAAPFSLVAVVGIVLEVVGYNLSLRKRPVLKPVLYLVGWLLLILSYSLFFSNSENNHRETFETTVPLMSFLLFGVGSLCFLINLLLFFVNKIGKAREDLGAV